MGATEERLPKTHMPWGPIAETWRVARGEVQGTQFPFLYFCFHRFLLLKKCLNPQERKKILSSLINLSSTG